MNINTIQTKTISKISILFITVLLTNACSESNSEDEQTTIESTNVSENVIDASKITLLKDKTPQVANIVTQQNNVAETGVFNASGEFTYPTSATEFSGNISVELNVSDQEGIQQVLLGFVGSDLTLPICEEDCSNQFSAFVNAINPKSFGLSSGEQTITLWVEDNDSNLSQVASLNVNWTELVVTDVTASIDNNTNELTVSWAPLAGALRYNVYLSNDINLTNQNYFELAGGDAKLALTTTSTTFTDKVIDASYTILVTAVDGSGESAFSDKVVLINGTQTTEPEPTEPEPTEPEPTEPEPTPLTAINDTFIVNEDQVLTGNLLTNDIDESGSVTVQTESTTQPINGSVIIGANGDFTYTPNVNFSGTDQFSYSIEDDEDTVSTATVSILITPINDSPIITSSAPTMATEDTLYTYTPSVSDEDDDNNGVDLTWSLTNAPTGMSISSTGKITWTPTEGQLSSGEVTITLADGGENSSITSTEKFTVNVSAVNDAPAFVDGNAVTVSIDENSPINTEVYTLLVNDPDTGAELTYNLPNGAGVFQLEAKAGTIYVSNASLLDFETTSSYAFDITVQDEFGLSDTITVTINVNDVVENTEYALDTSFSDNGISDFNTYADTEYNDYLVDAVIDDANNRYLLTYSNQLEGNDYVHTLSKLNQDGTFDLSFGNNGRKHLHINNLNDPNVNVFDDAASVTTFKPTKVKIDDINDKIYLLGYQDDGVNAKKAFWLRLNNDGSIDNTFDNDGKLLQTISLNDIQAVDLVTHSNGYIYLASSSLETSTETKTFILSKFDEQNSATTFVAHNFLSSSSSEQYITGLIENTAGDLVALGYATVNEDTNVIAASIDPNEITKVFNEVEFEFASEATDENKVHTNTLSTYNVIDSGTVLLGGSSDDLVTGNLDTLIVKLDVDSLALDTSFGGGDGFNTNDKGVNNENLISLDVGSDGNITYVNKVTLDSNTYKLFPYQLDSNGVTTTQLAKTSEDEELAGTSDNVEEGVADSNINAVVLLEANDSNNTVYIFSNLEKENYNGLSTPELINTEIEIYYEEIADNSNNTELGLSANRIDYDFQMADSLAVDTKLLHSSGTIITVTPRYNDTAVGDNITAEGHTITRHDLTTGLLNQEQNSLVQRNGYSDNYIQRHSTQLIALAETDSNGDNYLLSVEIIVNGDVSTLRATKFTIDGEISSGFPVEETLSVAYAYFESSDYNAKANRAALFGGAGYGEDDNNSLLVVIDVACLADESCQKAVSEENLGNTNGLVANYNRLTSGVVQDDGSVIALGFGAIKDSQSPYEDTFLVKVDFDSELTSTMNSDFDNAANDGTDDDVLTVKIDSSNDIHSGKLVQLSDSSLVYFATQTESDSQSYLVRLVDAGLSDDTISGQQHKIDVNFDDITGDDNEVDGTILLDMSTLGSNSFYPLNIEVKDLAVNSNDEIILVGNVNPSGGNAGFIAKFNGLNGEPDSLLAKNSLSGYYIPNGDAGCSYLGGQGEDDLCSIIEYDRVSIANDGSLIIHARLQDSLDDSYNSAILKFKEQQNDNASSYTIFNDSAD